MLKICLTSVSIWWKKMIAKFIESVFVSIKSFGRPWTSQSEKFISSDSESCLVRYDVRIKILLIFLVNDVFQMKEKIWM